MKDKPWMAHEAPLVELVQRLHEGRSLPERIKLLRYRRRKARVVEMPECSIEPAYGSHHISCGDAVAGEVDE